jgi:site-specific recombinase XerD
MKPTDFAYYLTQFLSDYLPGQKNVSPNTIRSYRDTFKLLLRYFQELENIPPEKLTMSCINQEHITSFLDWIEKERKCSISTRNLRLAAIHSFFRYAQAESPESLFHFQKVIAIPSKKSRQTLVEHLTPDGIRLLLEQPNRASPKGRRDLAMLSTLYDSGARVQELIDLNVGDFILSSNAILVLTGKGNKTRRVPLMKNTADILVAYISENHLDTQHKGTYPLFTNSQHNRLTKEGIGYILDKYATIAHQISEVVPTKVKCHMLRHSKAFHLLQAGVNLIYIRDFLGHSDIKTTEIYARADIELKRKALENAYPALVEPDLPDWNTNSDLMFWLSNL